MVAGSKKTRHDHCIFFNWCRHAFVALPSGVFDKGAFYFLAYAAVAFGVALVTMPRLLALSKEKGYITTSDFIKNRFASPTLSILIAIIPDFVTTIHSVTVGMQSVLIVMLFGTSNSDMIEEVALLISFVILALTSGLRGAAALTAVFKDILIWITVIALIVVVPLSISGGFNTAFRDLKPNYLTVPNSLVPGYVTLMFGARLRCISILRKCT